MTGFDRKAIARAARRMRRIGPQVRKGQRELLLAQAEELVGDMKRRAPEKDGELIGSIKAEDVSDAGRIAVKVSAGGAATTRPVRQAEKGGAPLYDYALAQELGTEDMPANPFFYPSYRAKRRRFKSARSKAAKAAMQAAARST